ncbi:MAG: hypothetical protein ACSLEX_03055 [Minisyncoccota bacterium]
MSEFTKKTTREVIQSNRIAIKSDRPKKALQNNPNLLNEEQKYAEVEINNILVDITGQYSELVPYIKRLKNFVPDITEETHYCAVYLLFCQSATYWDSIFLLAKNGNSSAIQVITRTIKEAFALTELFSLEFYEGKNEHLLKWFSGEIISNGAHRRAMNEFFEKTQSGATILEEMSRDLYRMESHSIHVAYTSVLECISPFTEDFDFEKFTRFRRTSYNLGYVKGAMDGTNIALKFAYKFLLRDLESYDQLEKILIKYEK